MVTTVVLTGPAAPAVIAAGAANAAGLAGGGTAATAAGAAVAASSTAAAATAAGATTATAAVAGASTGAASAGMGVAGSLAACAGPVGWIAVGGFLGISALVGATPDAFDYSCYEQIVDADGRKYDRGMPLGVLCEHPKVKSFEFGDNKCTVVNHRDEVFTISPTFVRDGTTYAHATRSQ